MNQQARPATMLAQLAQPSRAYRRRVWLAVTGLSLFLTLYLLLAGWFLLTAYRLTLGAAASEFTGYLVGLAALFLAVFMLKPLFAVRRGRIEGAIEITPQQQPRLYAFLHELADGAEAPRPHRVFLSHRVNAGVFYDLSSLNLVFPSKKNLEIGLGLVNALTLGEFRAVLAHEFGHFTQASMAVSRWVYTTQQIAAHLVARRDKLDAFLQALSRFDLRVAWTGWLLSLIVWSIRSLVDSAFGVLLRLERALSREMEMQADLVAVSLTGSDALINALHRLHSADDAWDRTLRFAHGEMAANRIARDVFTLHSRVVERMGEILSNPRYGRVPPVPTEHAEQHRVFKSELGQPPLMWLTHPPNHEREANAKRRYVAAAIDERSAWTLIDTPDAVREQVSAALLESQGKEPVPIEQSVDALNQQFDREYFNSRYRGLYVGRSVVRGAASPEALVGPAPEGWRSLLDQAYPESLVEDVAQLRNLALEIQQLRALQSGALKPPEGVIRHRGRAITPKELPHTIELVEREARAVEGRLEAADRVCRSVHMAAALELGKGWAPYQQGLLAALHYADHTATNLRDLHGVLAHTVRVVIVTRRVSNAGRQRVLDAANALHEALGDVFRSSKAMTLDASLAQRLGVESWEAKLGPYSLPPADSNNINEWLNVIDGWVNQAAGSCEALRYAALEQLLLTEATVAEHIRRGTAAGEAPAPSRFPPPYPVLLPGAERKRATALSWWQRFQIADGLVPTIARLAVAGGIVAAVLGFGRAVGTTATITLHNGLALPVVVSVGGEHATLRARASQNLEVEGGATYRIEAHTPHGQVIDSFEAEVPGSFAHFIYNVAGATPLVEWTAVYGNVPPRPPRMLGIARWSTSSADVLFDDPPESISSSVGGGTRVVLSSMAEASPSRQLDALTTDADSLYVIRVHARWDGTNVVATASWLMLAQLRLSDYPDILSTRLAQAPNDVLLLRLEQDGAAAADKAGVCARHRARSESAPDDADLTYVAARCITDARARTQAFLDGHQRWPTSGWFAQAVGYTYLDAGQWQQAAEALDQAFRALRPPAEHLVVDLARLHRLIDANPRPAIARLAPGSAYLRYLVSRDSGQGLDSPTQLAYLELARGHLDKALELARADSEVEARVLRLAAASDGAPAELVSRALALPTEAGLDDQTRWASIGLAARMGRDFTPLVSSKQSWPREYVDTLLGFLARARSGKNLSAAEGSLKRLPLEVRGEGYVLGVITLRGRAPAAWRHAAKQLLFITERPYFN